MKNPVHDASWNGGDQILCVTGTIMLGQPAEALGLDKNITQPGNIRGQGGRQGRDGIEMEAVAADFARQAQQIDRLVGLTFGGGQAGLVNQTACGSW